MWDRAERQANGHADPPPCATCRSEWPVRSRPPHPAELAQGLLRFQSGERWPAAGSTLRFAELLQEGAPRLDPASYVTTGSHDTFELMVRAHARSSTSSFLLCSLFSDALGLPSQAYLHFPRAREWEAAVSRYHTLFTAFEIRPQHVVLRLPYSRLYIGPHVQEYLVGLDSEWEEHLTRRNLAVQNVLCIDTALLPFPAAVAAQPEEEALASGSDPWVRGRMETGSAADRAMENPQIAEGRDVMSLGRSRSSPDTQPSTAPAILGATASMSAGTEGRVPATRGRRGRPRGSGRGSRPNITGRGAATNRGQTLRARGSEPPPTPG